MKACERVTYDAEALYARWVSSQRRHCPHDRSQRPSESSINCVKPVVRVQPQEKSSAESVMPGHGSSGSVVASWNCAPMPASSSRRLLTVDVQVAVVWALIGFTWLLAASGGRMRLV